MSDNLRDFEWRGDRMAWIRISDGAVATYDEAVALERLTRESKNKAVQMRLERVYKAFDNMESSPERAAALVWLREIYGLKA